MGRARILIAPALAAVFIAAVVAVAVLTPDGDPRYQPLRERPSVTKAQCEAGGGQVKRDGSPASGSLTAFCFEGAYGRRVVRH